MRDVNRLDAAEATSFGAIRAYTECSGRFGVCQGYRILAIVCHHEGEIEEAIKHFETALGIASASVWHGELFWSYYCMVELFFDEGRFDDAHAHAERAKLHSGGGG